MTTENTKNRFPLLRKILKAIGLPEEAIDDIVERILDWLSTKDEAAGGSVALPFKLRDDFLSNSELSFCQVLRAVVGDRAVVCAKVNLGDLFFVATGDHRKNRAIANRIDRKHVDFLLCEPKTMRPVTGIELDDKSHDRPERQERDELVDDVFAAANLPLVRVPAQRGYSAGELTSLLNRYLQSIPSPQSGAPAPPVAPAPEAEAATAAAPPRCPKCGGEMVLRTARTGANQGGKFWGCSNFPRCRAVLKCE